MKTTRLHTLEEVLSRGILVDGVEEPIKVSCIFIPKIQRSYAQGRLSESEVRTDFLNEIFSSLTSDSNTPLELNFLFGSKQPLINGRGDGFELLDGQQRATTLFLLYWYVYNREKNEIPEFLRHFTYETRDTSTQFLAKITTTSTSLSDKKPSDVLKENKWFTDDYNCDATICSMLNMLDDIHYLYNKTGRNNLLNSLSKLKFYVLLLEKFDMNDELYIKMNSRGLPLAPFENFKASLVKYMKSKHFQGIYGGDNSINGIVPFWLDFTSNLDAKWIDVFWKNPFKNISTKDPVGLIEINDREVGNRYFRFFNRYLFTKAALLTEFDGKKISSLASFFYTTSVKKDEDLRLRGWDNYEALFNSLKNFQIEEDYPVFGPISRVLNVFHKYYDDILSLVCSDPYHNSSDFDVRRKDGYKISHMVVFAAVTEFIERIPENEDFGSDEIQVNFMRMLRVVWNIVENTQIESDVAVVRAIKAVGEIITNSVSSNQNFYLGLAKAELKTRNRQALEEQEKAKEMYNSQWEFDQSWESVFKTAEQHEFFKGSIQFFFTSKVGDSKAFQNRYAIVKELFDSTGIADKYRAKSSHILIRALLSCLNYWDYSGMYNRYFTENAESNKYLKNILIGCPEVRAMFCNYFNSQNGSIDDYLERIVKNSCPRADQEDISFKMLFSRLVSDEASSEIYDWVSEHESSKKYFIIQDNKSYRIAIPGTWYTRIVLDTERHLIIPKMIDLGFSFTNKDQENQMRGKMKDSSGGSIEIKKQLFVGEDSYSLYLIFTEEKNVDYYIYGKDVPALVGAFSLSSENIVDGGIKVGSVKYRFEEEMQPIIDKVAVLEEKIKSLHDGQCGCNEGIE